MDSGSQATVHSGGGRSGGKILKRRPIAARKTPYDRPTPPLQRVNPNWVNVLVYPAKFVAGGAGKLLSSLWNPKSWGSRSSTSESDSDSERAIEDDENLHQNQRAYHGSWNIQNEIQRLQSKAIELIKPNVPFSLQALKLGNMASKDMKTTQDDVPTAACSSRPTTKEKKQIAKKKDFKDDKAGDDVEGNSDMVTEYAEVAVVIHSSQGSSNANHPTSTNKTNRPTVKRAATRNRKYNTRRGRPRGK